MASKRYSTPEAKAKLNARKRELYAADPERHKQYQAEYRKRNPNYSKNRNKLYRHENRRKVLEALRGQNLKRLYGMSVEEYEIRLGLQGGRCSICNIPPSTRRLAVDHCHITGKVRGLLCTNCNRGLGNFKDSPNLLKAAGEYLCS